MFSATAANMPSATRGLLAKARQLVPPMRESFHKGQLGRVAVIGGNIEYVIVI
ncbi:hypothetical protein KEM55_003461 [Ascosphaera atra]|nr:hypothetical protein KEM55_003461 [Ascosphaera atra]